MLDFYSGESESRIKIMAKQNSGFRFWSIRIQSLGSGQSESEILILANQNSGFKFWPIRIWDFDFGQ